MSVHPLDGRSLFYRDAAERVQTDQSGMSLTVKEKENEGNANIQL